MDCTVPPPRQNALSRPRPPLACSHTARVKNLKNYSFKEQLSWLTLNASITQVFGRHDLWQVIEMVPV